MDWLNTDHHKWVQAVDELMALRGQDGIRYESADLDLVMSAGRMVAYLRGEGPLDTEARIDWGYVSKRRLITMWEKWEAYEE